MICDAVGVPENVYIDNASMPTRDHTDLLPWILASIVMVIMGLAVVLYSNGPGPAYALPQGASVASDDPFPQPRQAAVPVADSNRGL